MLKKASKTENRKSTFCRCRTMPVSAPAPADLAAIVSLIAPDHSGTETEYRFIFSAEHKDWRSLDDSCPWVVVAHIVNEAEDGDPADLVYIMVKKKVVADFGEDGTGADRRHTTTVSAPPTKHTANTAQHRHPHSTATLATPRHSSELAMSTMFSHPHNPHTTATLQQMCQLTVCLL